jgi:5'-methylthioadenosine phosphorylase
MAKEIIRNAAPSIPKERGCKCASALKYAVITDRKKIPAKTKKDLSLILGKNL